MTRKPRRSPKPRHSGESRNPLGWASHRLAEIGTFLGGATPKTTNPAYWNGDIQWTTSKRLGRSILLESGERTVTEAGLQNSSSSLIPRGNLLIGTRVGVGKVAVNDIDIAISQDLTGVVLDKVRFNAVFTAYCLSQRAVQNVFKLQSRGTTIKGIPREDVRRIEFRAPPKPEQQKIAAVLWKLQLAVATQDQLIAATADLKQSAMHRLFTHGLRREPLKHTELGLMPESWQICSLSEVSELARGRFTHRPRNDPRFYGGNTPFVQTGDVVRSGGKITGYTQSLNSEGLAISRMFPKGTILITIAANIGFTGILAFDSACPDSLIGISCHDQMDAEFLNYYLQTQRADMDRLAPKGTQKNINIQFLQPWRVKVPSIDEQRDIAAALATIDRKLAHHRAKRAALDAAFQTALHRLMTGAVRVADLDIDTSDVQGAEHGDAGKTRAQA